MNVGEVQTLRGTGPTWRDLVLAGSEHFLGSNTGPTLRVLVAKHFGCGRVVAFRTQSSVRSVHGWNATVTRRSTDQLWMMVIRFGIYLLTSELGMRTILPILSH